ncbi:lectin-46Ca, partial [Drosophila busckii]
MRLLQLLIVALIIAYPCDVLGDRGGRRGKGKNKNKNGPCGKKYLRQINGKCYYFSGKKMNWFGAQNSCLRKGLMLADLANLEEYKAVLSALRTRGNMEDFWFGANDLQTEGRFTYIANGRLVRYFGEGTAPEPTQRSNLDDCMEVRLRENTTTMTDDNCQEQQFFICQQAEIKCTFPVEDDEGDGMHHSHEHLHHFHHDPAKADNKGSNQESLESDSRPADNSNSAEVGESEEAKKSGESPENAGQGGEGEEETTGDDNEATTEANATTTAEGVTGEGESTAEGAGTGETTAAPAEGASLPAGEGESTTAPADGASAAAAEGETTAAPAEGASAPAGDGESTAAPAE